jgi:hypothetical protein
LLILWFRSWLRNRRSVSECIKRIRERLPSEGMAAPLADIEDNEEMRA